MKPRLCLGLCLAILFVFIGCGSENTTTKTDQDGFLAQGYVRSVWTANCETPYSPRNNKVTVIGFEGGNGQLITIWFSSLEPRLWQGMYVKIKYRYTNVSCWESGYRPAYLEEITRLP